MKIYFAALLVFFNVSLTAQSTDAISQLKHFVHNIRTFNHLYPQEKVFLHCDNTAYFQGDTIWFNAYVVSASSLSQADLSKILYVELIAPEGEIITTQKLTIKNGQCHGQIALIRKIERKVAPQKEKYAYYRQDPRTKNYYTPLPSGYYEVRAYTHAMLNWGNDIIFSRVFPVFDTPEKEGDYTLPTMDNKGRRAENTRPKEKKQKKVNVTFYPEGGDIIKDLPSKVAFKVTDEQGKNISTTGYVTNKEKQVITNVTTLHEGMGSFCFTSQKEVYQLTLETENKTYTFPLPIVRQEGVALSADISKEDSLRIKLQRSKDIENDTLGISVICRGTPLYFKTIYGDCDKFQFTIPCDTLSEGVHQITVFDKKGEIHAERMVFIRSLHTNEWKEITTEFNKEEYKPFEQIEMKLKVPVKRTGKHPESCSVAIRDGNADILTNYSENLHTYLLLTSELKGTIYKPEFYFESRDSIHREALDLLMLTQGWRRYEWKQMAGVTPFNPTYHMEKGLTLTGRVLHPSKSKPIPDVSVSSCITQKVKPLQEGVIQTDSMGNFAFQFQKFEGKKQLTLSVTKGKQYIKSRILLNRSFSPPLKAFQFSDIEIISKPVAKKVSEQTSISEAQLLSDVTIKTKRRQAETYTI